MSGVQPLTRIAVGVVVERRKARSAWVDFTWQPVAVLPGQPDTAPWTILSSDAETATYYAGTAEIALYRTETGYYRDNLMSGSPSLWVALRPTGVEPPYEIVAVTADPAEGESFTQAGDDLVDAVPMPPETINSGADVIKLKGATTYAPSAAIALMADAVIKGRNRVMSVSTCPSGEYGCSEFSIGVPAVLGRNGVERIVELKLSPESKARFDKSLAVIKSAIAQLKPDAPPSVGQPVSAQPTQ